MANANKSTAIKIVAAVVILAVAGAVIYFRGRGSTALPDKLTFVCVETGKLYYLDRGPSRVPPVTNPDTGRDTLMPCFKDEDGSYYIRRRSSEPLGALIAANLNHCVDPKSLRVDVKP